MKRNHLFLSLSFLLVFFVIACKKEIGKELVIQPPVVTDTTQTTTPPVDSTITTPPTDTTATVPPTDTTVTTPPKDTTQTTNPVDTTRVPNNPDTTPPPVDTTHTTPPPPPVDTTHTTTPPPADTTHTTTPPPTTPDTNQPVPPTPPQHANVTIQNPGYEDKFTAWKVVSPYKGKNGFKPRADAVRTGLLGLNFYAAQPSHYQYAVQETPWNGKIFQTVKGLKDGMYTFKIYADAVGNGMYLWADGGAGEVKVLIKSDVSEINTLDFEVKGGVAKFGFICIDAGGPQKYAPYFHADDAELLKK